MDELHPTNQALLTILENQVSRTCAALAGMEEDVFVAAPGGDVHSIGQIGRHLVDLRRFQLGLLGSPRAARAPQGEEMSSVDELLRVLDEAAELVRQAIAEHDADDWHRKPDPPRQGPWGDEPTIIRFVRPLNDFTTHLGSIRTIRRTMGNPTDKTQ